MRDARPFALAGLWERWRDENGATVESCTIITTEANEMMRGIHDRMPVILAPEDYGTWLDPMTPTESLQALLRPYPPEAMEAVPASTYVSNPRNEGPRCLAS